MTDAPLCVDEGETQWIELAEFQVPQEMLGEGWVIESSVHLWRSSENQHGGSEMSVTTIPQIDNLSGAKTSDSKHRLCENFSSMVLKVCFWTNNLESMLLGNRLEM